MAEEQPEPGPVTPETPPAHEPVIPGPGELPAQPRLPLSIQVVDSRGVRVGGADVAIHWGPEGRDRVVARPAKSNGAGIASFQLPRQEYWASARSGGVEGRAPVPSNWDPRRPIIVRLALPGQGPGTPQAPKEEPRPATLTVVVKSAQGNQPLRDAEVRVFGSQGGPRVGRTDGGGRFHVPLPAGDYRIQASKAGYHPGSDGLRIGRDDVERTILLRGAIE